jgi:type IV pilus assembly protein PilF
VKYFILAMLFLTLSCASRKDADSMSKEAALHFGAGTQSLMNKHYTDALTSLLEANRLYPNSSEILNNLAMAYYFKGEKDFAVKTLEKSIKLNPENSDARINLASIYLKDNNVDKAEEMYEKILRNLTYDKQARTYYNLGLIQFENRKNLVKAEEYFQKSINEDENFCPSWHYLGVLKYKKGKYIDALKNFRESTMGTCQSNPVSYYYQALTMVELRRYDEARMKFDEVENRFPNSIYSEKSRGKIQELNHIERQKSTSEFQVSGSGKVLDTPEF